MKITREEARRIAGLAHLEFDDSSLDRLAVEMTQILGYIDQLTDVDVSLQDGIATAFREDAVRPSLDRDVVAASAPHWENGFFVVPKVIE